jgi:hypothetical protein
VKRASRLTAGFTLALGAVLAWLANPWRLAIYGVAAALLLYAFLWEPTWLAVRRVELRGIGELRLVHLSDIHYDGGRRYLERVVAAINAERPDAVLFTGDLVDDARWLDEALAILAGVEAPIFAVTGNHEHWGRIDLDRIDASLRRKSGRLLGNDSAPLAGGMTVVGLESWYRAGTSDTTRAFAGVAPDSPLILLFHEPQIVELLGDRKALISLAGHSHGGQVRLPGYGALITPPRTGRHDRGLYQTSSGPLYVTTGVGTWMIPVRFACRPEIVVFAQ